MPPPKIQIIRFTADTGIAYNVDAKRIIAVAEPLAGRTNGTVVLENGVSIMLPFEPAGQWQRILDEWVNGPANV